MKRSYLSSVFGASACIALVSLPIVAAGCASSRPPHEPLHAPASSDVPPPVGTMVRVEGGSFLMGNVPGSREGDPHELPVHRVKVESLLMGVYEVTLGEWKEVMGTEPSRFRESDNLPVEEVNWYDCIEFCNRKSLAEGFRPAYSVDKEHPDPENIYDSDLIKWRVVRDMFSDGYRLPTEAEWEYAARGGRLTRGTKYCGSDFPDEIAWYTNNSGNRSHPVGLMAPNELGLYDMSGNVWEWCFDWYDRYPGNLDINFTYGRRGRVVRGGSYGGFEADDIRCSARWCDDADSWEAFFGFRVCRSLL